MPAMLARKIVTPNRQKIVEGKTLLERAQTALDMLRRKEASGERLVWRIADGGWEIGRIARSRELEVACKGWEKGGQPSGGVQSETSVNDEQLNDIGRTGKEHATSKLVLIVRPQHDGDPEGCVRLVPRRGRLWGPPSPRFVCSETIDNPCSGCQLDSLAASAIPAQSGGADVAVKFSSPVLPEMHSPSYPPHRPRPRRTSCMR